MRALLTVLAFACGFGAIVALRQARRPFGVWSRATGEPAGAFLPGVWWRLTRRRDRTHELETVRREAGLWLGVTLVLLMLGLGLTVAAALFG